MRNVSFLKQLRKEFDKGIEVEMLRKKGNIVETNHQEILNLKLRNKQQINRFAFKWVIQRPIMIILWVYIRVCQGDKNILTNISMTQSGPIVQNVVSFAKMNMDNPELDLKLIAEKVQNSRYNKKRFPAVILRKTDPKSTILVFKSGKMIIIGSESQKDAQKVARKTARDISKALSIKAKISEFKVTNIVANAQIGWPIDIMKIADEKEGLKDESFPGVVYRGIKQVKAALLFSSGKVVFTGATERSSIETAFTQLKKKLERFKKKVD